MNNTIEVAHYNLHKYKEKVAGDCFLMNKAPDERIVATLADGMGSGVKANILSELTASMLQRFMLANVNTVRAANSIMETLPICSVRKVSYSTFTSLNISPDGVTKTLEYDNPELLWFRNNEFLQITKKTSSIETNTTRNTTLYAEIKLEFGDRLIMFSDGVTQAGMGFSATPLGWRINNVKKYIKDIISNETTISAKDLSFNIVEKAKEMDLNQPKDDITCAVVYYRKTRELMVITGPPGDRNKCPYMVEQFQQFSGKKIVSGGTTSKIIADGIGADLEVDMTDMHSDIPPRSIMKGAALVTEGLLTINKVINILDNENITQIKDIDAAHRMVELFIDTDSIYFLVGTAINEAHQNQNMPVEMGLRRISINKLANILREKYLKKVTIEYV